MKLLEDHAKAWLRGRGLPAPEGAAAASVAEAREAARALGGRVAVKALVAAGRRGKAGAQQRVQQLAGRIERGHEGHSPAHQHADRAVEAGELIDLEPLADRGQAPHRIGERRAHGRDANHPYRCADQRRQGAEDEAPPDFSAQEPLGKCPKCGSRVFEHGVAYVCEKAVGAGRTCDFRSGRLILQQPIEREQMKKLLESGRTDLLTGFVSKKNRKFKAFLVKQPDGKIGFEFQPRAPKDKAAPEEKPIRRGSERRARSTR